MRLTDDQRAIAAQVLRADAAAFTDLAKIAGLNPDEDFKRANLEGVDFGLSTIDGYDFTGASLAGANLSQVRGIERAVFAGANLDSVVWPPGLSREQIATLSQQRETDEMAIQTLNYRAAQTAFSAQLDFVAAQAEGCLSSLLSEPPLELEIDRPRRLIEAMKYSALGGGRRLRVFLAVEVARMFGVAEAQSILGGAAIELAHLYSLVHDDLPAMDNSDLRRGRQTLHKSTDDATALLTGDALLTLAFDVLTREETHPDPKIRIELVSGLARACGVGGLLGGQMLDLAGEGRFGPRELMDLNGISQMQRMKTGALLKFACRAGAILGGASRRERALIDAYSAAIAEAFQIADDLLDAEGEWLGGESKRTFVSELGIGGARERVAELLWQGKNALLPFQHLSETLLMTLSFVAERKS